MHYLNMIYLHTLLKGAPVSLRGALFLLKGALFLFLHGATPATTPAFNNLSLGSAGQADRHQVLLSIAGDDLLDPNSQAKKTITIFRTPNDYDFTAL